MQHNPDMMVTDVFLCFWLERKWPVRWNMRLDRNKCILLAWLCLLETPVWDSQCFLRPLSVQVIIKGLGPMLVSTNRDLWGEEVMWIGRGDVRKEVVPSAPFPYGSDEFICCSWGPSGFLMFKTCVAALSNIVGCKLLFLYPNIFENFTLVDIVIGITLSNHF